MKIPSPRSAPLRQAGVTLVELLLVMVVLTLLLTVAAPAVKHAITGNALTRAGDQVAGMLHGARQRAIATNRKIEVRFYRFADPSLPGETASGRYRALQLFQIDEDGSATALDAMSRLPDSVSMDSGAILSSLFAATRTKSFANEAKPPLAGVGTSYECRYVTFHPDGSTDLMTQMGGLWFVTLYDARESDNRSLPPPNYFTIQINAVNGSLIMHRPGL